VIRYLVHTGQGESGQTATFFHDQDVPVDMRLTNWNALTSLDREKFILMDDGTQLWAKITYVSGDYCRTTGGTFRIKDIIHCAIPKYEFNGYSGASSKTEHFLVRCPSKNELAKVKQLMSGEKLKGRMTERVKVLSLEKLQDRADYLEFSEEFVVDNLMTGITERDKTGRRDGKWLDCLKLMAKIKGTDLDQPNGLNPENQIQSGVNRFAGRIQTVQELRKIGTNVTAKTINDTIKLSRHKVDEAVISVIKEDSVEYSAECSAKYSVGCSVGCLDENK